MESATPETIGVRIPDLVTAIPAAVNATTPAPASAARRVRARFRICKRL